MESVMKRGDIYLADLNPVSGSEQGGIRPVLIISNDIGNQFGPTVIVAAITSRKTKKKIPTHFYLDKDDRLPVGSMVLFEQIRTIDKIRLGERLTHLSEKEMKFINKSLLMSIGIPKRLLRNERGENYV